MAANAHRGARPLALAPLAAVVIGVALLCGLGVWQVERLRWKTDLLAKVSALQTAPPEPLAVVLNRLQDHVDVDFSHVVFSCPTLPMTPTQRIYSVTDLGVGDRIITACPLVGGPFRSILVDRGFLETGGADRLTPSMRPETRPVVGVLRRGGAGSALAPVRHRGQEWFSRDVGGIAAALHAPDPAPVFFMLESPRPEGFGPLPAPIPSDIPNNHLGYALTWFGLAAGLIGVYLASRLKGRRGL